MHDFLTALKILYCKHLIDDQKIRAFMISALFHELQYVVREHNILLYFEIRSLLIRTVQQEDN